MTCFSNICLLSCIAYSLHLIFNFILHFAQILLETRLSSHLRFCLRHSLGDASIRPLRLMCDFFGHDLMLLLLPLDLFECKLNCVLWFLQKLLFFSLFSLSFRTLAIQTHFGVMRDSWTMRRAMINF